MTEREFTRRWRDVQAVLQSRAQVWTGGDTDEAERLVGNVLTMALRRRESLPSQGDGGFDFRLWSLTLLKWYARQSHTRRSRRAKFGVSFIPLETMLPSGDRIEREEVRELAVSRFAEERRQSERRAEWEAILSALKPRERSVLRLISQGYTLTDIAEQEGVTHQAVSDFFRRLKRRVIAQHSAVGG